MTAIDDLKAEIRAEVEAEIGPVPPAEWVVVRSSPSGVWFGRLRKIDSNTVLLEDARRAFRWTGAATCSGLATHGPSGGKIAAPVSRARIFSVCEVLDVSAAAVGRWAEVPPWSA